MPWNACCGKRIRLAKSSSWALGAIDLARHDLEAALDHFDQAAAAAPFLPSHDLDLGAERAIALSAYNRYGAAFAEVAKTSWGSIVESDYYRRRLTPVMKVARLCRGDPEVYYPECLIDLILDQANSLPPGYQPHPQKIVMVGGSLAMGGGELQMITIARRLSADPGFGRLALLIRSTQMRAGDDFLLPAARALPIDLFVYGEEWEPRTKLGEVLPFLAERPRARAAFELLPLPMREEILRICRLLRDLRPEAVQIWQDMPAVAIACRVMGVQRFFIQRGSLSPEKRMNNPRQIAITTRPMRHVYRRLLERNNFTILNNSMAGCREDQSWIGWSDARRFQLVHNAIDFQALGDAGTGDRRPRRSIGIPEDAPVVGGVFRLSPVKRPLFWIETAKETLARIPEAHFVLVGDGELAQETRALAERYAFADRLHMPGRLSDLGSWYRAMDVLLSTSSREGIPNCLIEAQYFGVPVVAPDVGGVCEAIDQERTGFAISGGTPQDYAAKVVGILLDPAWRARAAAECRRFVLARFDLDGVVDRLRSFYFGAIADGAALSE